MNSGQIVNATLKTNLVPSPARISVLLPPGYDDNSDTAYPLIYLLHGGDGDNNFLARMQAVVERAWSMEYLRPAVVVTPDADRSFYLDYRDGSQRWEAFLTGEMPSYVRANWRAGRDRAATAIAGISMGGMGALRIAFKHPELFAGVAALEPGIEPALSYDEIALRDRFWRPAELFEERFGRPVDREYWKANNPANIAKETPGRLRTSGLAIYLEAGDEDSFYLHYGTEFLHRILFDAAVRHEYRLIRGADHLGRTLGPRLLEALRFVGQALDPPPPDAELGGFHQLIGLMKRRAGYKD
jgi:S-formylglutathione hydrolase